MKKYSSKIWYKIGYNWTGVLTVIACTLRKLKPVGNDLDIAIFQKLVAH